MTKKKKYKGPIRVTVTLSADIHDEIEKEAKRQSAERGENVSLGRVMREWLDASADDADCNPLGAAKRAPSRKQMAGKEAGK